MNLREFLFICTCVGLAQTTGTEEGRGEGLPGTPGQEEPDHLGPHPSSQENILGKPKKDVNREAEI